MIYMPNTEERLQKLENKVFHSKWKPRIVKVSIVSVVIISFAALALATDFMGSYTAFALNYAASRMESSPEIQELADQIRESCSDNWDCMRNNVEANTPRHHTWFSSIEKPVQFPIETLRRSSGNCVDRAVFAATLLKELDFEHVYLVMQTTHMCVMVSDSYGIHTMHCIADSPIWGTLRVYSSDLA